MKSKQRVNATYQPQLVLTSRGPFGSIRDKIILPFLILTAAVAVGGTIIVTRLVAASVQDLLTNQLLETSRSASDSIVNWEQSHLDTLRLVVFTVGVPEALQQRDSAGLTTALLALAANQDAYMLLALDRNGIAIADVRKHADSYQTDLFTGQDLSFLPMVAPVLEGREDELGDKFAGIISIDGNIVLITVAPVRVASGELVGAIAIGTPLKQILLQTKADVLADLTLYQADGKALETTFVLTGETTLDSLNITPEQYKQALLDSDNSIFLQQTSFRSDSVSLLDQITVNRRSFQVAYVPLVIRHDTLGVIGVAYPSTVIATLIRTNRTGLALIFTLVTMVVVAAGYVIARSLSEPIRRLARTAAAVRAGDLSRQSGVRTSDEIGELGVTFDEMTVQLNARTQALRQAYEEQERKAAFLNAVLNSTVDGMMVVLTDGRVEHLNPAAESSVRANWAFWEEKLSHLVAELRSGGVPRQRLESPEKDRWIEAVAAPVYTASREEIGVVITLHDVTNQVLEERMRTSFIMQMSHELYTPLTAVKGYADLAKVVLKGDNDQVRLFLDLTTEHIETLNKLINQMLDVAQMTRGGLVISRKPVEIDRLLQAVVDEHREIVDKKNLDIEVRFGNLRPYDGDDERLAWAFKHLINNACTYTLPGGKVTVYAGVEDSTYIVQVSDTGVGIAPRELPRVKEQFFRGYPVGADGSVIDVRGAGLGLFVADKVIEAHGGQLKIDSEQGKGTQVTVTLPLTSGP